MTPAVSGSNSQESVALHEAATALLRERGVDGITFVDVDLEWMGPSFSTQTALLPMLKRAVHQLPDKRHGAALMAFAREGRVGVRESHDWSDWSVHLDKAEGLSEQERDLGQRAVEAITTYIQGTLEAVEEALVAAHDKAREARRDQLVAVTKRHGAAQVFG